VEAALAVRGLIRELNRQGCTILLTTHYMREAEELCGRIALIAHGRINAEGTAPQLKARVKLENPGAWLAEPTLEEVFLHLTRRGLEEEDDE
jgi:ABC-2 type transport system ATP-binding protein